MPHFRFLHAADLHLDSPLVGLSRKSVEYAARIDDASRRAFDNLIDLAIAEQCRFVVIAGDVFDGQWRSYQTGLFFAERMRRLDRAGIRVVMIFGNHDAENRFASRLELADNVHISAATLVTKSITKSGTYTGVFPFDQHDKWARTAVRIRQLDELGDRLKTLEGSMSDARKLPATASRHQPAAGRHPAKRPRK